MRLLAKARRIRDQRRKEASQVQRTNAQRKAEAKLDRERQGSTEKPDLSAYWTPNKGPQEQFFDSDCREILYGGQAGGGKSAALTALPLKWCHHPGFLGLTLRRTYPQGKQLRNYSRKLYRQVFPGLKPIKSEGYLWSFPSGAEATYGHCKDEDSHENYDGWEINLLCFDELTHFTEEQYKYLCARVRSSDPKLPKYIRATSNPGGPGHDWVFKHWGAWLDPDFEAEGLEPRKDENGRKLPPAKPGEVLWIRTRDDVSTYHREPVEGGLSRTFIPASLDDNPYIEPEYRDGLESLDAVRRAQLKDGDWLVRPAAGLYFNRLWCEIVDHVPEGATYVRYWDLAATQPEKDTSKKKEPDWTVGILMARLGTIYYIVDVIRGQWSPGEVRKRIKATAQLDGKLVAVRVPQDPGQAGKDQALQYKAELAGWNISSRIETGDKVQRFGPFSSQAETGKERAEDGKVKILRAPWYETYVWELEAFPTPGVKKDQVDATSGGFQMLAQPMTMLEAIEAQRRARQEANQ